MEVKGYHVTVYETHSQGDFADERSFEYGTWHEIGFWLDHNGYNSSRFYVRITFAD